MSGDPPVRLADFAAGPLLVGWVVADDVSLSPGGDALGRVVADAVDTVGDVDDHPVKKAVRDLLRGHRYKPSGRGKPASEFLRAAARRGEFPRINNLVDVNNVVSLESGFPASIIDLDLAQSGGQALEIRLGAPGESFVFNASGQTIDIAGLICLARVGGTALASPVKDSMATKVHSGTRRVLGLVWATREAADLDDLAGLAERFARLLSEHAGGTTRSGTIAGGRH